MNRVFRGALLGVLTLGAVAQATPSPALAKDFQLTGTVDCGRTSGQNCQFPDFFTGPKVGFITADISGHRQRVELDGSWQRKELEDVEQDDFMRFTVRDDAGPGLIIVSVEERHCRAGTFNQGTSTGSHCQRSGGDRTRENSE